MLSTNARTLAVAVCSVAVVELGYAADADSLQTAIAARETTRVQRLILDSKDHFVCAGVGLYAPRDWPADSPTYYFNEATREIISTCGGACRRPSTDEQKRMCTTLCPPPEWNAGLCNQKKEKLYFSKLPDLTPEKAHQRAAAVSGCPNNPLYNCEVIGKFEGNEWVFDVVYAPFRNSDSEDMARKFGKSRIVLSRKGRVLRYRSYSGKEH